MPVIVQDVPLINPWNNRRIHPGPQGHVGDVLRTPHLKISTPTMPIRVDGTFAGRNLPRLGSNVQDGGSLSYTSGGHTGKVRNADWFGGRGFKTAIGFRRKDVNFNDRRIEPYLGAMPQYSWKSTVASVYGALEKNPLFLNVPGPYAPMKGDIPRGGNGPVITNVIKPAGVAIDMPISRRERTSPNAPNTRQRWSDTYYKSTYEELQKQ